MSAYVFLSACFTPTKDIYQYSTLAQRCLLDLAYSQQYLCRIDFRLAAALLLA